MLELLENYFLIENEKRLDFLKDKHKDGFDTSHDTLAKHQEPNDIVNHFAKKGDPTPKKEHTQWILNQYKKKNIRQEDAPQIKKNLKDFEKAKPHLEKKDLNSYDHISDLRDAVATKLNFAKKKETEKKNLETKKVADVKELYSHEDGTKGYKIPNRESSIRNYGSSGKMAKTNWCTAANSENNMFNDYKGGKYTMHFPNGHVLQFHHQSKQIMDEKDKRVDDNDPRYKEHLHHIRKFITQTHELEGKPKSNLLHSYKHYEPHEIEDHMNKLHESVYDSRLSSDQSSILQKQKVDKRHIDKIMDNLDERHSKGENIPWHDQHHKALAEHISTSPHIHQDHIDRIIKNSTNANENVASHNREMRSKLMDNKNRTSEQLHHQLDNPDDYGTRQDETLIASHNYDESHIKKHIKTGNMSVTTMGSILKHHPKLSHETQDDIIDRYKSRFNAGESHASNKVYRDAIRHQDSPSPRVIDHIVNNSSAADGMDHMSEFMKNKGSQDHLKSHHYDKIMDNLEQHITRDPTNSRNYGNAIDHIIHAGTEASSPHAERAKSLFLNNFHVDDGQWIRDSTKRILGSSKLSKEDIDHAWHNVQDKGAEDNHLQSVVLKNPKAGDDKIHKFLDKTKSLDTYEHANLMKNKKLKGEHLSKMLSRTNGDSRNYDEILNHPKIGHDHMNKAFDNVTDQSKAVKLLNHHKVTETMIQKAKVKPHLHGPLSSSSFASPSTLNHMADSPLHYVRLNVAKHKNTNNETLKGLINDRHPEVAAAANKRAK